MSLRVLTLPNLPGWMTCSLDALVSVGVSGVAPGDIYQVWGSVLGTEAEPQAGQLLATVIVNQDGSVNVSPRASFVQLFPFVQLVQLEGTTPSALVSLNGTSSNTVSPAAWTWQVTLPAAAAHLLDPPAWAQDTGYNVGDVVAYPNGAYGRCTHPGVSHHGAAPAPQYYQTGVPDGPAAIFDQTGPEGFQGGFEWLNNTGNVVYTSSSPGLSTTNGYGPLPNGTIRANVLTPKTTYVLSTPGGLVTMAGYPF